MMSIDPYRFYTSLHIVVRLINMINHYCVRWVCLWPTCNLVAPPCSHDFGEHETWKFLTFSVFVSVPWVPWNAHMTSVASHIFGLWHYRQLHFCWIWRDQLGRESMGDANQQRQGLHCTGGTGAVHWAKGGAGAPAVFVEQVTVSWCN
jgi:hypothetical protein